MKIVPKRNTIFEFKVGDVVRCIDFQTDDENKKHSISNNIKYKIIELTQEKIILKQSRKYGWEIELKVDTKNIFNWVLNTKWVYDNYAKGITYRKYRSGGGRWR